MEYSHLLKDYIKFAIIFDFQKQMQISFKVVLINYWKVLLSLKEIQKGSGTFLRVWAKKQVSLDSFEKIIEFSIRESQLNIDF